MAVERFGGGVTTTEQYDALIRQLSMANNMEVYVLYENGEVLFPYTEISEEFPLRTDFSNEIAQLTELLVKNDKTSVVYSTDTECVYGATLNYYHGEMTYLYVAQSTEFLSTIMRETQVRIWFTAAFVFLVSFAISSALAGFLVEPLTRMREKASHFARGDFGVDFLDGAYGGEIVELAQALNFARDEISKADTMQKELIANVSHDFKTPLTMIKSYASMIREISGDIPEKRNKHALVIEEEADRLTALVNDVLELSKLASGIGELKLVEFNLSNYVYEVLNRFEYLAETQGYQFIVDIDEEIYTRADELKIGQVLYNLIGNAVNYTGEDKKVFVRLKRDENGAKFSVCDTGKGIKDEELSTIWERYYRSSEMHKRPVKGTGLGLSIVKSVLERHGFVYGARSRVGAGSEFYVVFPSV
jgi:signal transduction histidine kinase